MPSVIHEVITDPVSMFSWNFIYQFNLNTYISEMDWKDLFHKIYQ